MNDVGEEQYGDGMRTFVDSLTYTPEWIMVSPAMILIY
jgi:acetylornithine deacetylase